MTGQGQWVRWLSVFAGLLLLGGAACGRADAAPAPLAAASGDAAAAARLASVGQPAVSQPAGDFRQTCRVCHATAGLSMSLPGGQVLPVYVDPAAFDASVHGEELQCSACHPDIQAYPHAGWDEVRTQPREMSVLLRALGTCGRCHEEQYRQYLGSTHATALSSGDAEAPVCSDCHGSHYIGPADPGQVGLALQPAVLACQSCHEEQFDQYRASVHGAALLEKGDPAVPACVDCHGSHAMVDATATGFRGRSAYLCASCHADATLMARYNLSTDVFRTYAADFHGATAEMTPVEFEQAPATAVCYDCHGVHDIDSARDPDSRVAAKNVLKTCQECHADAGERFPAAWLGHHEPTLQSAWPVFLTNRFFRLLTSTVMLGLVGHIALEVGRTTLAQRRRKEQGDE